MYALISKSRRRAVREYVCTATINFWDLHTNWMFICPADPPKQYSDDLDLIIGRSISSINTTIMSIRYGNEPAPSSAVTLFTTAGPLKILLWGKQAPLTTKNFLQLCLDDYYTGTIFHRIVPGFVIQGGDPTGTGSGGSSIYEDPEFEIDPRTREKVVFKDEMHSRLRFNRRGLVGMAKSEDGTYGSQFFITLDNCERELAGMCTLFGRIEGDSIYNVVRISEGELIENTERPMYGIKITGCQVDDLGPFSELKTRRVQLSKPEEPTKKKKKPKAKVRLSYADEEEEEEAMNIVPKFNTRLVQDTEKSAATVKPTKRPRSLSPPEQKEQPKTPDPNSQIPLPDPEEPARPPTPASPKQSALDKANAEIEALKASMKRTIDEPRPPPRKKSALEEMIPSTSIRGRKRPNGNANGSGGSADKKGEAEALDMFNTFKARLNQADQNHDSSSSRSASKPKDHRKTTTGRRATAAETEEEQVCDLHFVVNCESCRNWSAPDAAMNDNDENENDADWMTHALTFGRDRLGKDLSWKRDHEDADGLVVIDPRAKEREIIGRKKGEKGVWARRGREKEGAVKRARHGEKEWDRR